MQCDRKLLPKQLCFFFLAHQKYKAATTRSDGRKTEGRAEAKSESPYTGSSYKGLCNSVKYTKAAQIALGNSL